MTSFLPCVFCDHVVWTKDVKFSQWPQPRAV